MMNSTVASILEHHGVKGMKWGRRKTRSTERTVFKKAPSKLSAQELDRRIKRMETEIKYNKLNSRDKSKGEEFVSEVMTNSGKKIATTVAVGAGLVGIGAAIEKKFGAEVAAKVTKRLK